MKQTDSNFAPDRAALAREARAFQAHPAFDQAFKAFCEGMVRSHTGSRLANIGLGHTLGWAVAVLITYLDHAKPEGTTSAQLVELCTVGGLAGAKAVKGAIGVLLSFGLVAEETHPIDRRAKRLRPTRRLLDIQSDNVVARLAALEILQPLPMPAPEWGRQRSVMQAFFGGNVEAFAHSRFRLYDGFPEIRAFMDRASGYFVLLYLLSNATPTSEGGLTATASASAVATRFDISRTHVRKLLVMARDQGWLTIDSRHDRIVFAPTFHRRLRDWIALEFAWIWWLLRSN